MPLANIPQTEKFVNDLKANSECKGMENQDRHTVYGHKVRKISNLDWHLLMNNEVIMDQVTVHVHVHGQYLKHC